MADSKNSRTLLAITRRKEDPGTPEILPRLIDRRNLLPVAARFLSARLSELNRQQRASGPTPVREMWPRWYACHQRRVRATYRRQKLEAAMLDEAGGFPVVELEVVDTEPAVVARSFADINGLVSRLDPEPVEQARAELRQRRNRWKKADRRLGYSAAIALEKQLGEQAELSGRVMGITRPSSVIEAAAKLHCLILMQDPGLKLESVPWPELRTMLKDLIRIADTLQVSASGEPVHVGEGASARDILNRATQYRHAAIKLEEGLARPNQMPQRLLALHSIELHLNALLVAKGVYPNSIRVLPHDLGERARLAMEAGLILRKRTAAHLAMLSTNREYHLIRYGPEQTGRLSQVNRVMATLDEVSRKVRKILRRNHQSVGNRTDQFT